MFMVVTKSTGQVVSSSECSLQGYVQSVEIHQAASLHVHFSVHVITSMKGKIKQGPHGQFTCLFSKKVGQQLRNLKV